MDTTRTFRATRRLGATLLVLAFASSLAIAQPATSQDTAPTDTSAPSQPS